MSVRHSSIRNIWNKTLLENIPSSLKLNILDNIHKSSKILDIGCGNGDDLLALREQGFTELFGIDVNRELVKSTKKLLGKHINISVQDATNLKFSDECFDYAIAKALLTVLVSDTSIKKCLREAYRVLKPGGILQIEDFFQNWHLEGKFFWHTFSLCFIFLKNFIAESFFAVVKSNRNIFWFIFHNCFC